MLFDFFINLNLNFETTRKSFNTYYVNKNFINVSMQ